MQIVSIVTIYMKCQILFFGKINKKNIISVSSTGLAQKVVKIEAYIISFSVRKSTFMCTPVNDRPVVHNSLISIITGQPFDRQESKVSSGGQ